MRARAPPPDSAHNGRMGIFQSRPEEPDEWAGLPSEPWQPRMPSEMLPPPIGTLAGGGTTSIDISFADHPELVTSEIHLDDGDDD